ncbi:MAG: ectonucleotide pyrophosphatase/phosphodiesterase [Phenylobacterium sp.]|uniref:alkaline phosphatase family protein n=1 Tax=Phenylobacterium sp. TaxID=1871053 RepID=UPI00391A16A5
MRSSILDSALALVFAVLLLAGCAHAPEPPPGVRTPVILISIDGFHPDYLQRGRTPELARLAEEGAFGAMRPSFPSKTFPNHYTLVTGLRPDRHGIVDNTMEDPTIPGVTFRLSNRDAVTDPRWWNDATPIWVSAERAGVRSATMFWPGSEAAIQGVRPSRWMVFDQSMPADRRTDQVLAWLDLPKEERPAFLTLYFDEVDTAGHVGGPNSAQLDEALERTDAALGRLVAGLKARGIAADLVIVSDHGMAEVSAERVIYVDDLLPPAAGRTLGLGAFMTYYPAPGREAEVEAALIRPHERMQCWRKSEIPAHHHYGTHRRVAPIFCLPQTGWEITTRARIAGWGLSGGNHGFDPQSPEMRALFIGHGPSFRAGARVAEFDNVDVYPLLARLLGVRPEPHDGDLDELRAAFAR